MPAAAKMTSILPFSLCNLGVEPVEVGEVGHVTLHCSDAVGDRRYLPVQGVDERAFFNEALDGGETLSAAATSDYCNFSFEPWH
jgi:hypothetical protein